MGAPLHVRFANPELGQDAAPVDIERLPGVERRETTSDGHPSDVRVGHIPAVINIALECDDGCMLHVPQKQARSKIALLLHSLPSSPLMRQVYSYPNWPSTHRKFVWSHRT